MKTFFKIILIGWGLVCWGIAEDAYTFEEVYFFQRMWPSPEQPWYFVNPRGMATDNEGYIYIADTSNDQIQKFTKDGHFIKKWGVYGDADGQMKLPGDIVFYRRGYVYVSDTGNHRIQKFTTAGTFVAAWTGENAAGGRFNQPKGLAMDHQGFLYVSDTLNHRIVKLTDDGRFVTAWGEKGNDPGEFNAFKGIAVDNRGYVYIIDEAIVGNRICCRIHKFTDTGVFVEKWLSENYPEEYDFASATGIDITENGRLFLIVPDRHAVMEFTLAGEPVNRFGEQGRGKDEFFNPTGICADHNNFIYVSDVDAARIQKFTMEGIYVASWGAGDDPGTFLEPEGICVSGGDVFIVDTETRKIQIFSTDGVFKSMWDNDRIQKPKDIVSDQTGQLYISDYGANVIWECRPDGHCEKWIDETAGIRKPYHIAIDHLNRYLYVTDSSEQKMHRFDLSGTLDTQWASAVSDTVEFGVLNGIAVDGFGNLYIADDQNQSLIKIDSEGNLIGRWENDPQGQPYFATPFDVDVDDENNVYVVDSTLNRIQKFSPEGIRLSSFGEKGHYPGHLAFPRGISVDDNGEVFVADTYNHRVQVFDSKSYESGNRAIIVSGGGAYEGNDLWDITHKLSNDAYRTLRRHRFSKDDIDYLSADTQIDIDGNGEYDDVDRIATVENLYESLKYSAKDAHHLIIYLVDHGGDETFRVNGSQLLYAADFSRRIEDILPLVSGQVVVIYDACDAGSFSPYFTSTVQNGNSPIFIAGAGEGQDAHFMGKGDISFSNFFWKSIYQGMDLASAFQSAKSALAQSISFQDPILIDDDHAANTIYIGADTASSNRPPRILTVSDSPEPSGNMFTIFADVQDDDGDDVISVRAFVRPQDYGAISTSIPLTDLPAVELLPQGEGHYEGVSAIFNNVSEPYDLIYYAKDSRGNLSAPRVIHVSGTGSKRKYALIISGYENSHTMETIVEKNVGWAYTVLKEQGYRIEDIHLVAPKAFPELNHPIVLPTADTIRSLPKVLPLSEMQDLVIYIIGEGYDGYLRLYENEMLYPEDLAQILSAFRRQIPGMMTILIDADYSGGFVSAVNAVDDNRRIIVTSTSLDEKSRFEADGALSFSRFFWTGVLNGMNIEDAYYRAKSEYGFVIDAVVTPQIDDNGNGIANENEDGLLAARYYIGTGIQLADAERRFHAEYRTLSV